MRSEDLPFAWDDIDKRDAAATDEPQVVTKLLFQKQLAAEPKEEEAGQVFGSAEAMHSKTSMRKGRIPCQHAVITADDV